MSFFQFNRYVMLCCAISTALPNFLEARVNAYPQEKTHYVENNDDEDGGYPFNFTEEGNNQDDQDFQETDDQAMDDEYSPKFSQRKRGKNFQNQDDILRDPNIRTAFATHILLQKYFSELKKQKDSSLVSSDMRETYLKLLLTWLKTAKPIFNTVCNKDLDKVFAQKDSENAEPCGEIIFQKLKNLLYLTPNGFDGLIPQNQWKIAPILGNFIQAGEFDSSVLLFLLNIGLENQSVHTLEAQNKLQQETINSKIDKLNSQRSNIDSMRAEYINKTIGIFKKKEKIEEKLNSFKSEFAKYSKEQREKINWNKLSLERKISYQEVLVKEEEQRIQKEQRILNTKNKILEVYKKLDQNHWFDLKVQSNFFNNNENNINKLGFDIQHELENEQLDFNYDNYDSVNEQGRKTKPRNSSNNGEFNLNEDYFNNQDMNNHNGQMKRKNSNGRKNSPFNQNDNDEGGSPYSKHSNNQNRNHNSQMKRKNSNGQKNSPSNQNDDNRDLNLYYPNNGNDDHEQTNIDLDSLVPNSNKKPSSKSKTSKGQDQSKKKNSNNRRNNPADALFDNNGDYDYNANMNDGYNQTNGRNSNNGNDDGEQDNSSSIDSGLNSLFSGSDGNDDYNPNMNDGYNQTNRRNSNNGNDDGEQDNSSSSDSDINSLFSGSNGKSSSKPKTNKGQAQSKKKNPNNEKDNLLNGLFDNNGNDDSNQDNWYEEKNDRKVLYFNGPVKIIVHD